MKAKSNIKFFVLLCLTALFLHCEKEDVNSSKLQLRKASSTCSYGDIHNDFMDMANAEFEIDTTVTSKTQAIRQLTDFYVNRTSSYTKLSSDDRNILAESIENNNDLFDAQTSINVIFDRNLVNNPWRGRSTLTVLIDDLNANAVISSNETAQIRATVTLVRDAIQGRVNLNDFEQKLTQLSADNVGKNYDFLNPALCVGESSLSWWRNTSPDLFLDQQVISPSNPQYQTNALPDVVGVDIAGAIVGAAVSASIQYGVTRNVNWKIVGLTAVAGAITSSTGVIGKLGKWISNLF